MRQSIRGYTDGAVELAVGREEIASAAAELTAFKGVVDSSDDLRLVLTDTGVPVASRRAVISDLLGSRVGPVSLRLLDFAIDSDRAPAFPENVSWLAARVEVAAREFGGSTGSSYGDAVLGRKAAEERLDGYATALLAEVRGEAALTAVEDELFRFVRTIAGAADLRGALSSRAIPQSARQGVIEDLLSSKATPTAVRLAVYATRIGRPRDYEGLLGFLVDRVASENDRRIADVRAPVELEESQIRNLATALARVVGRDVEVRVTVDPTVLGGFIATIGDTVVDGSSRHRLEILKERLVMPEATLTTGDPS